MEWIDLEGGWRVMVLSFNVPASERVGGLMRAQRHQEQESPCTPACYFLLSVFQFRGGLSWMKTKMRMMMKRVPCDESYACMWWWPTEGSAASKMKKWCYSMAG